MEKDHHEEQKQSISQLGCFIIVIALYEFLLYLEY